jgi:MYXO-CTERM domain-containing protein
MNTFSKKTKPLLGLATMALGIGLGINPVHAEDEIELDAWTLSALAPNVQVIIEGSSLADGSSNNIKNALSQTTGDFWIKGLCPLAGSEDFSKCDTLRFGLSLYPQKTDCGGRNHDRCIRDGCDSRDPAKACYDETTSTITEEMVIASWQDYYACMATRCGATGGACEANAWNVFPAQEDGGEQLSNELRTIHNKPALKNYCGATAYRPLAQVMKQHNLATFTTANKATWFERPNVVLAVVDQLPQTSAGVWDDQVRNTLLEVCENLAGRDGDKPPMPTWVMAPRRNPSIQTWTGMMSGAGNAASCCLRTAQRDADGNVIRDSTGYAVFETDCDPIEHGFGTGDIEPFCDHIKDAAQTEAVLRERIAAQEYHCGPGQLAHQTMALWGSTLPAIRCSLYDTSEECDPNLFGTFVCIRQLPKGTNYDMFFDEGEERFSFRYCPSDGLNCVWLKETVVAEDGTLLSGNIEFLDPSKTMFALVGTLTYTDINGELKTVDACQVVDQVDITRCILDEGSSCQIEGETGRCADGEIRCINRRDVCVQKYFPMPEICNGIDDGCSGNADDMSSSLNQTPFATLPADKSQLACQGRDICVCPNGPDPGPAGYEEPRNSSGQSTTEALNNYLANYTGACYCSQTIEDGAAGGASLPMSTPDAAAGCTAIPSGNQGALGGAALLFLALAGAFGWRRRRN